MRPQQGLLSMLVLSSGHGPQSRAGTFPGHRGALLSQQRVTLCRPHQRQQFSYSQGRSTWWVLGTCLEATACSGARAASHPCEHLGSSIPGHTSAVHMRGRILSIPPWRPEDPACWGALPRGSRAQGRQLGSRHGSCQKMSSCPRPCWHKGTALPL